MKRILLIFCTIAFAATAHAQLVFSPDTWDFGSIRETNGAVSHTFTATNRGDKPVVILNVITTCGCTVPTFSRKPVLSGDRASITLTYDPANRPGGFVKNAAVITSDNSDGMTLTIRGEVVPRPKSIEELYAIDAGGGLRIDRSKCVLGYIQQGQTMQFTVSYVNTAKQPVRVELRPASPSGLLTTAIPPQIASGEKGEINLMYRIPADKPFYGTLRDTLQVYVDGRSNGTYIITQAMAIDKSTSKPTGTLQSDTNIIRFGTVKRNAPEQQQTITLTNTGKGALIIRAVETGGNIRTTLRPGQQIPAESAFTATVTLDPAQQDYGTMVNYIRLITNDPAHPMRQIRVAAIIEK